jgi:hypothetical protein
MPSATYELFLRAMREKKQIGCVYQGYEREICPILLGRTGLEEKSLVFQFGGRTSKGPIASLWPRFGGRCCATGHGIPATSTRPAKPA